MPAFSTYQSLNGALKRKANLGAVLLAAPTATAPTTLTGSDSTLAAKPTGYNDLGWTTDDGATMSRSVDKNDITGWQGLAPIRSDVTSDVETIAVTFHETNAYVINTYFGVNLSALVPDAASGEVSWAKPSTPDPVYARMLILSRDTISNQEFLFARSYPRVSVTDWDDLQFGKNDDGIVYGMTFTAYNDDVLGYTVKTFLAGIGVKTNGTAMRFPTS